MESDVRVTVGVDTHADAHVSLALAQLGLRLGEEIAQNDESGYRRLLRWTRGLGELACVGIERQERQERSRPASWKLSGCRPLSFCLQLNP
jgi:hypothetical protein